MDDTFFTMQPRAPVKYILLASVPSIVTGFAIGWNAAAWVFILLAAALLFPRAHMLTVYDDTILETQTHGSKRFICEIFAYQIKYVSRNRLGEIVLFGADSRKLICVESSMTNRDRLERWLSAHNIESK